MSMSLWRYVSVIRTVPTKYNEKWPRTFSGMLKQIEATKELRTTSIVVLGRQRRTFLDANNCATLCNTFGICSPRIAKEPARKNKKSEELLDFGFLPPFSSFSWSWGSLFLRLHSRHSNTRTCCCLPWCLQTDTGNELKKQFTAQILVKGCSSLSQGDKVPMKWNFCILFLF